MSINASQCAPPASTGAADLIGLVIHTKAIKLRNKTDEIQKISVAAEVLAWMPRVRSITAQAPGSGMPRAISVCTDSPKAGFDTPVCSASCA